MNAEGLFNALRSQDALRFMLADSTGAIVTRRPDSFLSAYQTLGDFLSDESLTLLQSVGRWQGDHMDDDAAIWQITAQRLYDDVHGMEGTLVAFDDITNFKAVIQMQHEFWANVTHDMRSPLTTAQGYAYMLRAQLNDPLTLRYVNQIMNTIRQITNLVDNIQDAGRFDIQTGYYHMERSPCDLREIIQRITTGLPIPADKQQLTLKTAIADDVPILYADQNMIERALGNLVDNAIKYTPDGGHVIVEAFCRDRSVVISVKDDGFGISEVDQARLFQRHVRLNRAEYRKIKGTGLGLFIVRMVAEHHGGRAWVESAEGAGSTFFFSLPLG